MSPVELHPLGGVCIEATRLLASTNQVGHESGGPRVDKEKEVTLSGSEVPGSTSSTPSRPPALQTGSRLRAQMSIGVRLLLGDLAVAGGEDSTHHRSASFWNDLDDGYPRVRKAPA